MSAAPPESPPEKESAAPEDGAKSGINHFPARKVSKHLQCVKEIRSRSPEPPYAWQSKDVLRKIREHLDGESLLPYALSVYCALTENASDKEAEEFTTLQGYLARLAANISTRTVRRVLPLLREIGVIDYQTPKLRGPITFRLLAVRTNSPNVVTNSPNVRTRKKTAFQSANRNNNEVTKEVTKEVCVFSSLKEAVAFFEPEFPEVPVKHSLTLLVEKRGKECLTKSYCWGWLKKEQRRKRPRPADPPAEPREQAEPQKTTNPTAGKKPAKHQWRHSMHGKLQTTENPYEQREPLPCRVSVDS